MRFVTRKPPTTLMVANTTARNPKTVVTKVCWEPAERMAPTNVIPEMAFDPDMRGVWRVGGIFVIISNPTNRARTKMVIPEISKSMVLSVLWADTG